MVVVLEAVLQEAEELAVDGNFLYLNKIMNKIFILAVAVLIFSCQQSKHNDERKVDSLAMPSITNHKDSLAFANDTISLYRIDSIQFFEAKGSDQLKNDTIAYIDDFKVVKELLKGQVTFGDWDDDSRFIDSTRDGQMIAFIRFPNGDTINPNYQKYTWDAGFVRYYPSEYILLMEGGHTSDFSIDLKQGLVDVDLVGNPAYIVYSPKKKYRMNGSFPGQECSDYFLQYQTAEGYKLLSRIPMDFSSYGFDLCTLTDIFWKSENELYFRNTFFGVSDDSRLGFFMLKIN